MVILVERCLALIVKNLEEIKRHRFTNTFIIDSKPVMAATQENNFKNPNRNTRNKKKKPKRNPAATLGYYSYQQVPGRKDNYIFFWGYRTFAKIPTKQKAA